MNSEGDKVMMVMLWQRRIAGASQRNLRKRDDKMAVLV